MALTRFHALLIEKVGEKVLFLRNDIAAGALEDYAAYKYHAGVVAGLLEALNIAKDIDGELDGSSGSGQGN